MENHDHSNHLNAAAGDDPFALMHTQQHQHQQKSLDEIAASMTATTADMILLSPDDAAILPFAEPASQPTAASASVLKALNPPPGRRTRVLAAPMAAMAAAAAMCLRWPMPP